MVLASPIPESKYTLTGNSPILGDGVTTYATTNDTEMDR